MKISIIFLIFLIHCNLSAQDVVLPNSKEFQQSLTPSEVIKILKDGNQRFINNMMLEREYHTEVKKASHGQFPWAVLHRCMDSRVSPEIIFDTGIGDVFVNGLAGNVINDEVIGSMEYACNVVGSKLILVLGHTGCGAVIGAIDEVEFGNITTVLNHIHPAVDSAKFLLSSNIFTSDNSSFVDLVTRLNVKMGLDLIRSKSPALKELEDSGKIKIAGAIYNIETGEVTFLE